MCGIYNITQIYCLKNTFPYDWYNQKVNDKKYFELENIRCFHHLNTYLGKPPCMLIQCTTTKKLLLKDQVFKACQNQNKNVLTSVLCISDFNASTYWFLPQKCIFDSQGQENKSDHFFPWPIERQHCKNNYKKQSYHHYLTYTFAVYCSMCSKAAKNLKSINSTEHH